MDESTIDRFDPFSCSFGVGGHVHHVPDARKKKYAISHHMTNTPTEQGLACARLQMCIGHVPVVYIFICTSGHFLTILQKVVRTGFLAKQQNFRNGKKSAVFGWFFDEIKILQPSNLMSTAMRS